MRDRYVKIKGEKTDTKGWSSRCRNYKHLKCTNINKKCMCPCGHKGKKKK